MSLHKGCDMLIREWGQKIAHLTECPGLSCGKAGNYATDNLQCDKMRDV